MDHKKTGLRLFCEEWFNATSAVDWENVTVEEIRRDLESMPDCRYSAEDVYSEMVEVVAEYKRLNEEA